MPSRRAYAPVIGSMTDSSGLSVPGFEPRSEPHDEHVVEEADTAAGSPTGASWTLNQASGYGAAEPHAHETRFRTVPASSRSSSLT